MDDDDEHNRRLRQEIEEIKKLAQKLEKKNRELKERIREAEEDSQKAIDRENQEASIYAREANIYAQAAKKRTREAKKRIAPLKLGDFLKTSHTLTLALVPIKRHLTQDDITKPAGRPYPSRIVPWNDDFLDTQAHFWDTLRERTSFFDKTVFPSLAYLEQLKSMLEPVSSEMTLRAFQSRTVEDPVRLLMDAVHKDPEAREHLGLQGTISFIDEPSNDDIAVQRFGCADQFCVHQSCEEKKVPTLAIEYKPPHKLSREEIVTGLVGEVRPALDVIDKSIETFADAAKRLSTAVIVQLFAYMVDKKLRYGFVCQGEVYIFLRIPEDDPSLVQYFVSVPSLDAPAGDDDPSAIYQTAVAQVFAFIMQAIRSHAPEQHWCDQAARLPRWCVEYEMEVLTMLPSIRSDKSAAVEYKPNSWPDMPFALPSSSDGSSSPGNSSPRAAKRHCEPRTRQTRQEDHEGDEEDQAGSKPTPAMSRSKDTFEPRLSRSQQKARGNETSGRGRGRAQRNRNRVTIDERPYCTNECLKGLAFGGPLDSQCPNATDHGHAHLGAEEFLRLMREQLASDRGEDADCTPLHVSGSCGSLFKLRLSSHGYTLVAKGVEAEDGDRLLHENEIYDHLHDLQGRFIPVCLGTIDLVLPYYYNGGIYMHFMLMTYAGRPVLYRFQSIEPAIAEKIVAALSRLHEHRVLHRDAELRNVLYDDRTEDCMMVDLIMSEVHKPQPPGDDEMDVKKEQRGKEQRRKEQKDEFAREMQGLRCILDRHIKAVGGT